ncbi:hypothetical protein E4T56_gene15245 [Termitomyces sp. T112]|nr:hypothetical protein E4T56_gene15245 [Termitomyces sp. T112]
MRHLLLITTALVFFVYFVTANDFAGANSYFLHTLSAADRAAVLDAMQSADMKLLRVFITRVAAGAKGSSAQAVDDLETVAGKVIHFQKTSLYHEFSSVGSYDDTILTQIDVLASEAHSRDIKLIIAMHDRYALGCWDTDAYVAKYNLPVTGCVNGVPDSSVFYTNTNAIADFDNRLRHILNFQSPTFDVPWNQLSDAIFSFEIENEGTPKKFYHSSIILIK